MPAFPTLPSGAPLESEPHAIHCGYEAVQDDMECGTPTSRDRFGRGNPRKIIDIVAKNFTDADKRMAEAFINDHGGGARDFTIPGILLDVIDPYIEPTLAQVVIGAAGGRTYYVKITFSDGTDETGPSQQAILVIDANKVMTLVPEIHFPDGVTQANIYIGTVDGVETFVGILRTSGGTWTEGYTTVDQNSAAAQKNLFVDDTTYFDEGELIIAHKGGAREETGTVDSKTADKLVMVDDLQYLHTGAQQDPVQHAVDEGAAVPLVNTLAHVPTVLLFVDPTYTRNGQVWSFKMPVVQVF
jgi:hypothetical protein